MLIVLIILCVICITIIVLLIRKCVAIRFVLSYIVWVSYRLIEGT